jgi:amino-acid N-acetyltransferase
MTAPSLTVRQASEDDVARVESLLETNELPHRDVRAKPECFFVARSGTAVVGIGGIERYGANGLLRSVVVAESKRGHGYGAALCDALEDRARADEVATLYLLTTTAEEFFSQRGYEVVSREAVPSSIRGTTEFAELCPDSATCMRKHL